MAKLKLQAEVLSALEHAQLLNFSAAQRAVVSTIKSGQNKWLIAPDLSPLRVAVAATIIHKLKQSHEDVARALILVQNSEIAEEYAQYFETLGKHTDLRVWMAYQGPQLLKQKEDIYFGADVVIATPKRLNELLNIEGFNSAAVQTLVLDASDQLLKVGNIAFTQRISDSIPTKQRVSLSTENKGSTTVYMDQFAFPFSIEEF
ncbi:MAG: DEAD/DEAH box helicase [Schleiferiaceae bacterium]|nr:DEAD/DEAH box helicase [Schleiferiaceae bacterium]MDG1656443.1 DEAD/DEAH box helicase [Schleiferiaceae bacterium]